MKKLFLLVFFAFPVLAEDGGKGDLPNTAYNVSVDQAAYERVFLGCVAAFKGPEKTTFNDLDEAIEACDRTARSIAFRGKYTTADGNRYITAVPTEQEKK